MNKHMAGVKILRTVPTPDWVLLGSGELQQGVGSWQPYLQLVCRRILPLLAATVCNSIDMSVGAGDMGGDDHLHPVL